MTAFLQISPLATVIAWISLAFILGCLLGFVACWIGRKRYWEKRSDEYSQGIIEQKKDSILQLNLLLDDKSSRIEDLEVNQRGAESDISKTIGILRGVQKALNTRAMNKE